VSNTSRIDRRQFLQQLSLAAAALATRDAAAAAPSTKPNIVLILSDDVGYGDISSYGATHIRTPHIDSIATTGLRFTNAHSDAATCTPSRYALLTGSYGWRRDGVQVLPGDAKSLIQPNQLTIASVLKSAGYTTGLVGKWHVGLGDGNIDWNGEIKPGPNEAGFDDAFFFAATADRVPTVYIHNHRVVNLDPADPIHVSYKEKIGTEPTGKEDPQLLKMKLSEGHDGTIVDGVSRIGFMTGGHSARWKDEEMAATFTNKAVEFIERNQHDPFFLIFTPSDIHVPRMPAPQFAGTSTCGVRCDVISQLDWSVGRILETLKRLHLDENTILIFTSDNGPVVNDGYDDGADHKIDGHKPAGPFRGGKYTIFEGGTRLPFLVRWTGHITPGTSAALISQLDLLRTFATLTHQTIPPDAAPDSTNVLPALLGKSKTGRTSLIEEATVLAIVEGNWKLIDRSQHPGTQPPLPPNAPIKPDFSPDGPQPYPVARIELYDLATDPRETKNVAATHPEIVARLTKKLTTIRTQGHS
jgi:arylsulfatase A-like enzyme